MQKTLPQIIESIYIASHGGQYLDEAAVPSEALEPKVDEARGIILAAKWRKDRRIHPSWLQTFYPEYVEEEQDEVCCTSFYCPAFLDFGINKDGLNYIGSENCPTNFVRIWDRVTLASQSRHPVMKAGRRILALWEPFHLKLYANEKVLTPMVNGVFASPSSIFTYSKEKDSYPADPESVELIEQYVREKYMMMTLKTPQDTMSNSVPVPTK